MTQFYDKIIYTGNGTKDLDNKELEPKLKNVLWIYKRSDIPKSNAFSFNIWNNGAWQDIIAQQYINEQDIKDCKTKIDYCEGLITEYSKFKSSDTSNIMIDTTLTGTQLNELSINDALNKILFKEEEPAIVEQQTLEVEYDPYVEYGADVRDLFNSTRIKQKEKLVYNYGCKSFTENKADNVEKNVDLYGICKLTDIITSSNQLTESGTFSLSYRIEDAGYYVCSRKGIVPEDNHPTGELTKQIDNLQYIVYVPFYYSCVNDTEFANILKIGNTNTALMADKLNSLKVLTGINQTIDYLDQSYFILYVPYDDAKKYSYKLCANGIELHFAVSLSPGIKKTYTKYRLYNSRTGVTEFFALFYIGSTDFDFRNINYKLIINEIQ